MENSGIPYALSKLTAAKELAERPEAQDVPMLQNAICRKHGIFLDSMTDDEVREFEQMIEDFAK